MIQIPDAAVQAALEAVIMKGRHIDYTDIIMMRSALTAAYPHLPLSYEVKQLEWVGLTGHGGSFEYSVSPPSMTKGWRVWVKLSDKFASVGGVLVTATAADEEEAKAAAQADFEHRVRECIVAKPVDVAEVRRQAFEEAANIAKDWWHNPKQERPDMAIRALSAEPAQGGGDE